jgi:hypothetical protein
MRRREDEKRRGEETRKIEETGTHIGIDRTATAQPKS